MVLEEVKILEALRSHANVVNYKHSWLEMSTNADFGPDGTNDRSERESFDHIFSMHSSIVIYHLPCIHFLSANAPYFDGVC